MSEETKRYVYKQEDIFQEIENDPENVNMTIPPEIMERMGWKAGDRIKVLVGDQGTVIIEKVEEEPKENNEQE